MKKNEDYGLVLSIKEDKNIKSARIIGTNYFQLINFELNPNVNINVQDKIFIGKGSDFIKKEKSQLIYDDLNKTEKFEVQKAIHSIVITNEEKYVEFFNKQSKDASQLHLLNDKISRKSGSKILAEKELNGNFKSFKDIDNRIRFIKSSKELIISRILHEIIVQSTIKNRKQIYLFTIVKQSNKKNVMKYDKFVDNNKCFIEMIKEKGLIEKEGKLIK